MVVFRLIFAIVTAHLGYVVLFLWIDIVLKATLSSRDRPGCFIHRVIARVDRLELQLGENQEIGSS